VSRGIVIYLCFLCVISSVSAKQSLTVRGSDLQLPLKLKVKIKDYDPTQQLVVSGLTGKGKNPELVCRFYDKFMKAFVGIRDLIVPEGWVCEDKLSGNFYPINQNLTLAAVDGKANVNSHAYRGQIQLVRNGRKLMLINQVDIEDYLVGLVNKEINSKFPEEAIKAQAIAARSYAMATVADRRKKTRIYDLLGTEEDQVYQGASYEDKKARRLVELTRGEVLYSKDDILKAYYHAASGGHSEEPQNVWLDRANPVESAAYIAMPSPFDEKYAPTRWSITLSASIGDKWSDVGRLKEMRILERSRGLRVKKLLLVGDRGRKVIGGAEFRRMIGNRWLKSTLFYLKRNENSWTLEGKGFGHGVGMSQLGAKFMAKNGRSAEEILTFYYPKAKLQKVY